MGKPGKGNALSLEDGPLPFPRLCSAFWPGPHQAALQTWEEHLVERMAGGEVDLEMGLGLLAVANSGCDLAGRSCQTVQRGLPP